MVSKSNMSSFDEALTWAVRTHDTRFAEASMVGVSIEQHMVSKVDEDEWHPSWTASVRGLIEEKEDADVSND